MNRDALPAQQDSELLSLMLTELRTISATLRPPVSDPTTAFLQAICAFTGTLAKFTACELLEQADGPLLESLGDRDANRLGRELADCEGAVVFGRCLVRKGKSSMGVCWAFE